MNVRPLLVLAALTGATRPDGSPDALAGAKDAIRRAFTGDPMGSVWTAVAVSAWAFYRAEHGKNPKVRTFEDALVYVTTNLSVGYCDVLAVTPRGKLIGSLLMTYGPAMAAKIFDAPAQANAIATNAKAAGAESSAIVERLDRILALLEERERGARTSP